MPIIKYDASYGGVPMLISSIRTERGRDIAVHSPAQGDTHTLANQGKKLRRATAEILFLDQPGLAPYDERYEAFVKLFEDGKPHVLSHPIDGSYVATGEALDVDADSGALQITVSATFLHEQNERPVLEPAAGVNPTAGVDAVTVAADRAAAFLAEFPLEPVNAETLAAQATPAAVKAEVERWAEADDLDSQDVFLGVASMTQQIDEAINLLKLTDISKWEAFREMVLLRYELVRAAAAFTGPAETIVEIFVEQPSPVLALAAELYGADVAQDRAAQIVTLNRLRTPARVPAGTTLKVPAP